ncbi:hypothetical protein [Microtetraspora niveoalba]|uniref:hypothetical protein n=1 Tax=Microtetraspora niveoalba TaxID=46175 RepID=UPI0008338A48|nr:hypothetical protein [Microtetraspora niveoalba]
MPRIAISGHRGLPQATAALIEAELKRAFDDATDVIGLSCLADGADQIFARAVVEVGGRLEVVVPAQKYREGLPPEAWREYDALISRADRVHQLDFVESTSEAHMAASVFMLDQADHLFAVWDGKPARGFGGTADVVAEARSRGMAVRVVWPEGAERD